MSGGSRRLLLQLMAAQQRYMKELRIIHRDIKKSKTDESDQSLLRRIDIHDTEYYYSARTIRRNNSNRIPFYHQWFGS